MSVQQTKHLYTLSTVKQLVDINKDVTNFRCKFSVISKEGKPFEAVILNQSSMDESQDFPFQQSTDGTFGGEIIMDKNTYQNFYLALRASEVTVVEVDLEFEALPDYVVQPDSGTLLETSRGSTYAMKGLFAAIAFIVAIGVAYIFIKNRDDLPTIEIPKDLPIPPKESLLSTLKNVPID
ncbi:hypothetical protein OAV62_02155 [bacterium]|nr:hypothetical protein [bacterium]